MLRNWRECIASIASCAKQLDSCEDMYEIKVCVEPVPRPSHPSRFRDNNRKLGPTFFIRPHSVVKVAWLGRALGKDGGFAVVG